MAWYFYALLGFGVAMDRLGARVRTMGTPASFHFAAGVWTQLIGIIVATTALVCSLTRLPESDARWAVAGLLTWAIVILSIVWASRMLTGFYPARPPRF